MAEQQRLRTGWLAADFFTHSYRISGHVNVRARPLADQLNDRTTSFLELEDAYLSPIDRPADIVASYAVSALYKNNVTLVVVTRQEDGLSRKETYGSYLGPVLQRVFITVPGFEVEGYLRLPSKMDVRTLLATGTDRFIPILDATTVASLRPDVKFVGGIILVNKDYVGAICLAEEDSFWCSSGADFRVCGPDRLESLPHTAEVSDGESPSH